ncbi:aspartate aminotransferase [Thermodesulfovibrio aggregans]|uniref:Aminotransferase n=1 Tax=Thermodesulfovibrio aggregans TaxID=86166 RepID=A0A0U9HQG4_9BACT|nr:pyridoxal phosphate-dependent aminotransferase [Thermodesulfovibrio aggregans]GAQ95272.1 aspartate aminotransferase [Thermodesulfovibrio aggregans]
MIAERAKKVKPSPTLAVDSKAKELKAKGFDVVNFGVGEPDFDTPEHIKEAAIKAIRDGFTKYTPVGGIDELKEAIIEKLERDNGLKYGKENILVSCGAKHSLYNIAQALFGPGDEVIIPSPYWVSYPDQVLINDAQPVIVETKEENDFMVEPDALKEKITPRTKAIIINSPSNPTGFIYTKKALEEIAEIALKNNIYIISDEIYEKLIYDGEKHISIASLSEEVKERTIVVNGLSKSHAMTGWRIGYAAGPVEIIKTMTKIQSQSTSNPTSIAQKAAVAALKGPQDCVEKMRQEFEKRRDYLVKELNNIAGVSCRMPKGAFYVFPNVNKVLGKNGINSSMDLSIYLLEKAFVALVPGSAFGTEGYIRISYATSMENLAKGIERIRKSLEELR